MIKEIKQKKQDLGIFYTDQRIADFMFDILKIWKEKEEKESGRWESKKHFPSVIDPAVGEGIFLKVAVESGFTKPDWIFGLDIDEDVVKKWKEINLLKAFGGKEDDLEAHFFHQNGLEQIKWEQHTNKYRDKLKQKDIGIQQFDTVVGNPPYGGLGLSETELSDDLIMQLANFEVLPENVKHNLLFANKQSDLFNSDKHFAIKLNAKQRIKAFPIEILFLEHFLQLAKPGGWIAIIIPDGILTNSSSHYVREFISKKAKVEAVVSLPRDAFKNVGTSAKTSILFLQKYKEQGKKRDLNYPVFFASVDSLDEKNFNFIKNIYQKYYNKTMSNKNLVQTTTDEKGREIVMVRVDKTLKEMMEEKPASRWDPGYWHPDFQNMMGKISGNYDLKTIGDFVSFITYGQVGKRVYDARGEVDYIQTINIQATGIDYEIKKAKIKENSHNDPPRSRLKYGDLLVGNSGMGGLGKVVVFLDEGQKVNISQDIDLLRLENINPYYLAIYLKTEFGNKQIWIRSKGVGAPKIAFDEVKAIKIPVLLKFVQNHIEFEYRKMSKYHDKAMEAKKNNDEAEYKKNIETAEKMLKDLIAKTEAVIRGECEDI